MPIHVAIVTPPYDRLILDGAKTVECRLTRTPLPPFGRVTPGDRVFFKRSGGPFFAVARIAKVWLADALTPADVDRIRRQFDAHIHGDPSYWNTRRDVRYATLIWLREVRPCATAPKYKPQNMRAWYTLDDDADPFRGNGHEPPVTAGITESGEGRPPTARSGKASRGPRASRAASFDIELSAASLRRRYVRIGDVLGRFPPASLGGPTKKSAGESFELRLADGPTVATDIVAAKRIFRWRGWGPWFHSSGLSPGDRLRFTPVSAHAFTVRPIHKA